MRQPLVLTEAGGTVARPHTRLTSALHFGATRDALQSCAQPGVDLAVWQRGGEPRWSSWLDALPVDVLPAARLTLAPADVVQALRAAADARGTPSGALRDALFEDVAALADTFAHMAGVDRVRLRLDVVTGDACRRWHRDCVPLRLVCTYRGPGTEWVLPGDGAAAVARPDDDAAHSQALQAGDVAVFKGCGWPGQAHDVGIVHRSPRLAGSGRARLVLVLDAPWDD